MLPFASAISVTYVEQPSSASGYTVRFGSQRYSDYSSSYYDQYNPRYRYRSTTDDRSSYIRGYEDGYFDRTCKYDCDVRIDERNVDTYASYDRNFRYVRQYPKRTAMNLNAYHRDRIVRSYH